MKTSAENETSTMYERVRHRQTPQNSGFNEKSVAACGVRKLTELKKLGRIGGKEGKTTSEQGEDLKDDVNQQHRSWWDEHRHGARRGRVRTCHNISGPVIHNHPSWLRFSKNNEGRGR